MTTPREQLAATLREHLIDRTGMCACGVIVPRFRIPHAVSRHLADAIIAAGWTPPAQPEEEEEPFSRMSYEAMEAKLAQQESAPRMTQPERR